MLRFPSLVLSEACLSLLQFAWTALNFHSLSGQQGVQRNQGDPVRESESWETAKSLQFWNCTGCGKSSAESYEPFRYKCSCLVSLSLDSLESWAFAHFFYCILLLCCPKALEPSVKGLRPAFVSLFLTKVDKRLYNSLWSWGATSSLCPDRHRLFKLQRVVAYGRGGPWTRIEHCIKQR